MNHILGILLSPMPTENQLEQQRNMWTYRIQSNKVYFIRNHTIAKTAIIIKIMIAMNEFTDLPWKIFSDS